MSLSFREDPCRSPPSLAPDVATHPFFFTSPCFSIIPSHVSFPEPSFANTHPQGSLSAFQIFNPIILGWSKLTKASSAWPSSLSACHLSLFWIHRVGKNGQAPFTFKPHLTPVWRSSRKHQLEEGLQALSLALVLPAPL